MFGEFRVTKKSSGGVPGYEYEGLKGVVGRVPDLEGPMNASLF